MIEVLNNLIPKVIEALDVPDSWDSLVINRRQPVTYRVFRNFGDYRVCLHKFEPCESEESFAHPHPWPGAFLMLRGEYIHRIGASPDLQSQPTFFFREIVRPYSMYEIIHQQTWHTVQPTKLTYTIMCNGAPWENQHKETRTTKGKDLDKFSQEELHTHLSEFGQLLDDYQTHLTKEFLRQQEWAVYQVSGSQQKFFGDTAFGPMWKEFPKHIFVRPDLYLNSLEEVAEYLK